MNNRRLTKTDLEFKVLSKKEKMEKIYDCLLNKYNKENKLKSFTANWVAKQMGLSSGAILKEYLMYMVNYDSLFIDRTINSVNVYVIKKDNFLNYGDIIDSKF